MTSIHGQISICTTKRFLLGCAQLTSLAQGEGEHCIQEVMCGMETLSLSLLLTLGTLAMYGYDLIRNSSLTMSPIASMHALCNRALSKPSRRKVPCSIQECMHDIYNIPVYVF